MGLMNKFKVFFNKFAPAANKDTFELEQRLSRLERGYIVLLKRVLEIDGVQFSQSKLESFTSKVLQTPNDEVNKGLNEPKPTLH